MALCKRFIAMTMSKLSLDWNASRPAYGLRFVARNRGVRIAIVNRSLTPNLSLNADVPHAGCARQRAAG